jgi:hypothetical protein
MESIQHGGRTIGVREIARPAGWSCRVLISEDGAAYLEYLVSVGPHKIDMPAIHPLTREELTAFQAGRLDLGALARDLAEHRRD